MKILLLDIETAPNKAYVWGLFDQNIAANQVEASSYTLCWSAKWLGKSKMHQAHEFGSSEKTAMVRILEPIHNLLEEADIVVHYNGLKFDIPTLNKEFLIHGFTPPSPYKQVDLLQVARRAFRFQSNKLTNVTAALGMGSKIKTDFSLWVDCMRGDEKAWKQMLRYNAKDVRLLERLYFRLRPWIKGHPNMSLDRGSLCCPKCSSIEFHLRDKRRLSTGLYQRYHCQSCGTIFRSSKRLDKPGVEYGVAA